MSVSSYLIARGLNPKYIISFCLCGLFSHLCGLSSRLSSLSACAGSFLTYVDFLPACVDLLYTWVSYLPVYMRALFWIPAPLAVHKKENLTWLPRVRTRSMPLFFTQGLPHLTSPEASFPHEKSGSQPNENEGLLNWLATSRLNNLPKDQFLGTCHISHVRGLSPSHGMGCIFITFVASFGLNTLGWGTQKTYNSSPT